MTTPSPHYPQYLHTPPPGSPVLPRPPALPHPPTLAPARSVNASISYTRSTSLGNQNESARPRPQYNTSLSLTSPVVHQVSSFGYAGGTPRTAGENPPVGVDSPDYSEPRGDGLRLRPPHSYRQAVGGGKIVEDDREEEGEELQVAERGVVSEVEEEEHDKYHTRNPFSVSHCMSSHVCHHHMHVTTCMSPHACHHMHVTTCMSMCLYMYIYTYMSGQYMHDSVRTAGI